MRLLCITDLHGDPRALERIIDAAGDVDVLLLGGDITHFGTPNIAEDIVRRAQRRCPQVMAVAGNCDSRAIDDRLVELGISLFRRGIQHEGVGFYGVSAMPPWMGNMYELSEEEIGDALRAGRQLLEGCELEVVLSHTPPRDTQLDCTRSGQHVGSSSVRRFVEQVQPALVVCGHIHESRGIDKLGPSTLVNCGAAVRGHYALADVNAEVRVELRTAE
jgi:Icc-related predicted phosphoesterase